jgi:hypothetical protein
MAGCCLKRGDLNIFKIIRNVYTGIASGKECGSWTSARRVFNIEYVRNTLKKVSRTPSEF